MRPTCFQFDRRELAWIEDDLTRDADTRLDYRIEAIGPNEAAAFIKRFEYLKTPGRNWASYAAINQQNELAAVAIFGRPIPMPPHTIVLERGACAPWAHPHCASWFIPKAVRRAAQDHGWHTFIAFADPEAGELGTIYKAANWLYLGQTPDRLIGGKPRLREYYRQGDGPWITERAFRKRGLVLADMDLLGWERAYRQPKHKYVQVEVWANGRHDKRAEHALRATFKPLPYPAD
jgi:hypothetical protein